MKKKYKLLLGAILASIALVACSDATTEDKVGNEVNVSEEQAKHISNDIDFDAIYQNEDVKMYAKEMIGKEAPGFSLQNLKGDTVSLESFKGQNVLIELASTTCSACIDAHPTVASFKNGTDSNELEILTVFANDSKANIEDFFTRNNYERDEEAIAGSGMNSVFNDYKLKFTPTFLFVDKEGYIQFVHVGSGFSETDLSQMSDMYLGTKLMEKYATKAEMKISSVEE